MIRSSRVSTIRSSSHQDESQKKRMRFCRSLMCPQERPTSETKRTRENIYHRCTQRRTARTPLKNPLSSPYQFELLWVFGLAFQHLSETSDFLFLCKHQSRQSAFGFKGETRQDVSVVHRRSCKDARRCAKTKMWQQLARFGEKS